MTAHVIRALRDIAALGHARASRRTSARIIASIVCARCTHYSVLCWSPRRGVRIMTTYYKTSHARSANRRSGQQFQYEVPSFYIVNRFHALGLPDDSLDKEWFTDLNSVASALRIMKSSARNVFKSAHTKFTLIDEAKSRNFRDTGSIEDRVAMCWPAHCMLTRLLLAKRFVDADKICSLDSFEEQLQYLSELPGWSATLKDGTPDPDFLRKVSDVLELMYFNIPLDDVRSHSSLRMCYSAMTFCWRTHLPVCALACQSDYRLLHNCSCSCSTVLAQARARMLAVLCTVQASTLCIFHAHSLLCR